MTPVVFSANFRFSLTGGARLATSSFLYAHARRSAAAEPPGRLEKYFIQRRSPRLTATTQPVEMVVIATAYQWLSLTRHP
jgi:hypothetical protein